jgi:hypothetical protein
MKPKISACATAQRHVLVCKWHKSEVPERINDVRFSNRPFGVKRFQTIHHYSVDVAHGLVLLYGIGTKALVWGFLCQGICQGRASFSFVGFLI